jgi:hypothetical protein
MHKLKFYHFSGKALTSFSSYLLNTKQTGNLQADILVVRSGFLKDQFLNPYYYINDTSILRNDLNKVLYASGSSRYQFGDRLLEIQNNFHKDRRYINDWYILKNMSLNRIKTKCVIIGSSKQVEKRNHLLVKVNINTSLENVTVQKLLGIYVINTLKNIIICAIIFFCTTPFQILYR